MILFFFHVFSLQMELHKHGVQVVPLFSKEQVGTFRHDISQLQFPEFPSQESPFVMGGFGGYGHPSSFHNPVVRAIRQEAYPLMRKFFQKKFDPSFHLEQLFDRLCVRPKGSSTSKESWHRDISPMVIVLTDKDKKEYQVKQDENVFGGWINLDEEPQYFSCSLSTHRDRFSMKKRGNGFALQNVPKDISQVRVPVPSGHAIVFYQNILHQVLPKKQKKDSFRLFQSFRVSRSSSPMFPKEQVETWIREQATPLLPSGQHPPMYSSNHSSVFLFSNGVHDPIRFSQKVHPFCQSHKTCGSGKHKGKTYSIIHRHMTSLTQYQLPLYPPYRHEESRIFFPQKLV